MKNYIVPQMMNIRELTCGAVQLHLANAPFDKLLTNILQNKFDVYIEKGLVG